MRHNLYAVGCRYLRMQSLLGILIIAVGNIISTVMKNFNICAYWLSK